MKKILIVFGTRPEAIKMAPLVYELKKYTHIFNTKICVTAQHRQMLDQVLNLFEIEPDYDLNIMKAEQDLYDITSRVLLEIKPVILKFKPDIVLVHGDTTTGFAAALAAYYSKIKVGHVEAGLRTGNIYSPFPEEINRKLIGSISSFHFSPTIMSANNLRKENNEEESIIITGNTVIDALFLVIEKINKDTALQAKIKRQIFNFGYELTEGKKIILVTGHRRENFGEGFLNICKALKTIAEQNNEIDIIYPVHLNPNVRRPVNDILSGIKNIYLIEPLGYEDFIYLMSKSYLVITDSGGIQEEAPSLGKPVLVIRETTERPEAVKAGTVRLVGTNYDKIVENTNLLLNNVDEYTKMSKANNPYGDGKASEKIVKFLMHN